MAQPRVSGDDFHRGNVYACPDSVPTRNGATAALDLVYQAADVFRALQDRVRETEADAQSLRRETSEKVRRAEMRAVAAEQDFRQLVAAVDCKLEDASRALEEAHASIRAQAEKLTAAEFRAQEAEAETRVATQALVLVEETIRKRLLVNGLQDPDVPAAVA